jgi:hypothetical protein
VLRDRRDITLASTPTARKEAKQKAKLQRKRATKAAATRKANRDEARSAEQNAHVIADYARQADQQFWTSLKARMAAANLKRRATPRFSRKHGGGRGLMVSNYDRDLKRTFSTMAAASFARQGRS